jgi:hypothetical protein
VSSHRLRYIRYADDHLLGFAGTNAEAEQIKNELAAFLRTTLKLDLSTEKTLITHARTHKARFLGYDIWTRQADTWHTKGGRSLNGSIALGVPPQAVNTIMSPLSVDPGLRADERWFGFLTEQKIRRGAHKSVQSQILESLAQFYRRVSGGDTSPQASGRAGPLGGSAGLLAADCAVSRSMIAASGGHRAWPRRITA